MQFRLLANSTGIVNGSRYGGDSYPRLLGYILNRDLPFTRHFSRPFIFGIVFEIMKLSLILLLLLYHILMDGYTATIMDMIEQSLRPLIPAFYYQ
ncbi:hypothetical protein D3C74_286920 [compost metagenome]